MLHAVLVLSLVGVFLLIICSLMLLMLRCFYQHGRRLNEYEQEEIAQAALDLSGWQFGRNRTLFSRGHRGAAFPVSGSLRCPPHREQVKK